jgi:hypothetical protein
MTINRAPVAVSIEGLPEMPIYGLRLMDIVANAKAGLRAYNTAGLELDHVSIDPESGPAFLIRNSRELTMTATERRVGSAAPVIRLDDCSGVVIRGSRLWPGNAVLLSEKPGEKAALDSFSGDAGARVEVAGDFWKGVK